MKYIAFFIIPLLDFMIEPAIFPEFELLCFFPGKVGLHRETCLGKV